MKKNFTIGREEKHQISFRVNWFFGYMHLSVDGRTLLRRPFFLRLDRTFEVGSREKHLVRIQFDVFDYFRNVFKVVVDGHDMTRQLDIRDGAPRIDTPVDDAAAALLFVVLVNVLFSVIGTLFVPYLHTLQVRMMLLLGAMIYMLFFIKVLGGSRTMLLTATLFFFLDSMLNLYAAFSPGGLVVRLVILYYLAAGLRYAFRKELPR